MSNSWELQLTRPAVMLFGLLSSGCMTPSESIAPEAPQATEASDALTAHYGTGGTAAKQLASDSTGAGAQRKPRATQPATPGKALHSPAEAPSKSEAKPGTDAARKLRVVVEGVSGELRENVNMYLSIRALESEGVPSEARLRWLHAKAEGQISEALIPFGYYRPSVQPALQRTDQGWLASYRISPGEPVRIRRSDVRVIGEGSQDRALSNTARTAQLGKGEVLVHSRYENAKSTLQSQALSRGYFDGRFTTSRVSVDIATESAEVVLIFDTGPRYRFGTVSFEQDFLDPDLLERYQTIEPGTPYLASKLVRLQSVLATTHYFEGIAVDASPRNAKDHTIPVLIRLTPSRKNRYDFRLGYGTDTGARASAGYIRRRVNRLGHGFSGDIFFSETTSGVASEYSIPGSDPRTDRYLIRAGYAHVDTTSFTSDRVNVGVSHQQQRKPWRRTLSLDYQIEESEFDRGDDTSKLLLPSVDWLRASPDDRLRVERGARLEINVRGAHEKLLSDVSFLQGRLAAKVVHPFAREGRFILRAGGGSTVTTNLGDIPATVRFFAGGDRSIRGYKLDSIGPENSRGNVIGGKHLLFGSAEYEHTLVGAWSAAVFTDVGDAFTDSFEEKVGAGIGVRWNSPVGPVRVDIAHGFQNPGDTVRLHINIGPDL